MTNPTTADLLKYVELQMASEAFLAFDSGVLKPNIAGALVDGNLHSSKFTEDEATKFVAKWAVIDQEVNTPTGFSGTLFQNKETNELVMSFRSTEFIDDAARDNQATNTFEIKNTGWAWGQIADMEKWYGDLKTSGKIPAGAQLSVTGYSLGGHLATAFNLLHPTDAQQVVTFNGAGVGKIKQGTLQQALTDFKTLRDDPNAIKARLSETGLVSLYSDIRSHLEDGSWTLNRALGEIGARYPEQNMGPQAALLKQALEEIKDLTAEAARVATLREGGEGPNASRSPTPVSVTQMAAAKLDYRMAVLLMADNTLSASAFAGLNQAYGTKAMLGVPVSNQFDVVAATTPSAVAHSLWHIGQDMRVPIEDQPLWRGDIATSVIGASLDYGNIKLLVNNYALADFGDTHSLVLIADSLAVQNTISQMLPQSARSDSATASVFSNIFSNASNLRKENGDLLVGGGQGKAEGDTLESVINALSDLAFGPGVKAPLKGSPAGNTWASTEEVPGYTNRVDFYQRLDDISKSDLFDKAAAGDITFALSPAGDLAPSARTDFSAFAALYTLSPFVLTTQGGEDVLETTLASAWGSVYQDWKKDKQDIQNGVVAHELRFTDQWLQDRATLLQRLSYYNDKNADYDATKPGAIGLAEAPKYDSEDIVWSDRGRDIKVQRGGITGMTRYVTFGADTSETDFASGNRSDSIYAGGGSDTLNGLGGNDWLEGGSGLDTYQFEGAFGHDTIVDSDGQGQIKLGDSVLTGGKQFGKNTWFSADNTVQYHFIASESNADVGTLRIRQSGQDGAGKSITINNFRRSSNDLGITLGSEKAKLTNPYHVAGNPEEASYAGDLRYSGEGLIFVSAPDWEETYEDVEWYLFHHDGVDYSELDGANLSFNGLGGKDWLIGARGHDHLDGGDGDDLLYGFSGSDELIGGRGNDVISTDLANGIYVEGPEPATPIVGADAWSVARDESGALEVWHDFGPVGVNGYEGGSAKPIYSTYDSQELNYGSDVDAGEGNDIVIGGYGADAIHLGEGNDIAFGAGGDDDIIGGAGNDHIYGDRIKAVYASASDPSAKGGDDYIVGGAGNDVIFGDYGSNTLIGGGGNDILVGGFDFSIGAGQQADTRLLMGNDVTVASATDSDAAKGINNLVDAGVHHLDGGSGDDTLIGGAFDDTLLGGGDGDYLYGALGDDYLDGGTGANTLRGGGGNDTLITGGSEVPAGQLGANDLSVLEGGAGDDTYLILANAGDVAIRIGVDEVPGQTVDAGQDRIVLQGSESGTPWKARNDGYNLNLSYGDSSIQLEGYFRGGAQSQAWSTTDVTFADGSVLDAQELLASTQQGTEGDDTLFASPAGSELNALGGNDEVYGQAGDDHLDGGAGNDLLMAGGGNDVLEGGTGDDVLHGQGGNDTLRGGAGNDLLRGGAGVDQLEGGEGNDTYLFELEDRNEDGPLETDVLRDTTGNDVVHLGTGIVRGDVVAYRDNQEGYLLSWSGGAVRIEGGTDAASRIKVEIEGVQHSLGSLLPQEVPDKPGEVSEPYSAAANSAFLTAVRERVRSDVDLAAREGLLTTEDSKAATQPWAAESSDGANVDLTLPGSSQIAVPVYESVQDGWTNQFGQKFAANTVSVFVPLSRFPSGGDISQGLAARFQAIGDAVPLTQERVVDGVAQQVVTGWTVLAVDTSLAASYKKQLVGFNTQQVSFQSAYAADLTFGGADNRGTIFAGLANGGDGNDTLTVRTPDGAPFHDNYKIEVSRLTPRNERFLTGDAAVSFLDGGAGDDALYGGSLADVLYGGSGNNSLFGGEGPDRYLVLARPEGDSGYDYIADTTTYQPRHSAMAEMYGGLADEWVPADVDIDTVEFGPGIRVQDLQFSVTTAEADNQAFEPDGNYYPTGGRPAGTEYLVVERDGRRLAAIELTDSTEDGAGVEYFEFQNGQKVAVDGIVQQMPHLSSALPDAEAMATEEFSYVVPAGTFVSAGGQPLSISIQQVGGAALPAWLHVEEVVSEEDGSRSVVLSGTPIEASVGILHLKITASTPDGTSVSDVIDLTVLPPTPDILVGTPGDDILNGSARDNIIWGDAGNDTINGRGGNDQLHGDVGNNIYLFGKGDGQDRVFAVSDSTPGKLNTLQFKPGVMPSDIELRQVLDPDLSLEQSQFSLEISIAGTSDKITFDGFWYDGGTGSPFNSLQQIKFPDGTTWDLSMIQAQMFAGTRSDDSIEGSALADTLHGQDGNDALYGLGGDDVLYGDIGNDDLNGGAGNDTIVGGAGEDFLTGGTGDDILDGSSGDDHLFGAEGNNVYLFGRGDGRDLVETYQELDALGRLNTLRLKAGVAAEEVQLRLVYDSDTDDHTALEVSIAGAEDSITFNGFFVEGDPTNAYNSLQRIEFADGTYWDLSAIVSHLSESENEPPETTTPEFEPQTVQEDDVFSFAVPEGTFTDSDESDTLTYSATLADGSALPTWLSFNAATRTFSGTPTNANVGSLSLMVIATDEAGATANSTFSVTITNVNDAPTVSTSLTAQSATENAAWSYAVPSGTFTDVDTGDTLTYSATLANGNALPSWLSFNASTRTFSGNPAHGDIGSLSLKVTATDNAGATASSTFALTVGAASNPGQTFTGTAGNDTLTGTAGDDMLYGLDGNDTLNGGDGNDTIVGGLGDDTMSGGNGDDTFLMSGTNSESNRFQGDDGYDVILGSAGDDLIRLRGDYTGIYTVEKIDGGGGTNILTGDASHNILDFSGTELVNITRIEGGTGNDTITGSSGNDIIVGGVGDDTLIGGAGDDTFLVSGINPEADRFQGGEGYDVVLGSAGNDTIQLLGNYQGAFTVEKIDGGLGVNILSGTPEHNVIDLSNTELVNIARIEGGTGNDTITGSSGNDIIVGGVGDDTLIGGAGDDTFLVGGILPEADRFQGGSGYDVVLGSAGDDTLQLLEYQGAYTVEKIDGGLGTNILSGTPFGNVIDLSGTELVNIARIEGGSGNDTITGTTGNDTIVGGADSDRLIGGDGDDTFLIVGADAGTDRIEGSAGYDIILGSTGDDVFRFHSYQGIDTVEKIDGGLGTNVIAGGIDHDTIDLSTTELVNIARIEGGIGDDFITGSAGNDVISGGGMADRLAGGLGNDTYLMARGYGSDTIEENDATSGNSDMALFDAGIATDQLWFSQVGNNLEVSIIGTADKFTVKNWYLGSQYHVEKFKTSDGKVLLDSQVQNLVQAMAAFSPPAAGQTTLPTSYANTLNPTIAANWQ